MNKKSENSENVIDAVNLTLGYDDFILLENISFSVKKGEIFAILGGSGCGKSTILKHLIGLYSPLKGDIMINGSSIVDAEPDEKNELMKQFGVLYQSGALFSSLTLEENVAMPLREFTDLPENIISAMSQVKLSLVGLEGFEGFAPSEISGGMKKRAGLARAMSLDPAILFFDEPSAGLDPISSADLDKLILKLRDATGTTMVIVTHELDSIFTVADRVIILDKESKGIVAEGDPRYLRDNCDNAWVKEFLNRSNMRN